MRRYFVSVVLAAATTLAVPGPVCATTVLVTSVGEGQAQVIIDGQFVRTLGVGETSPEGVLLKSARGGAAVFVVDGKVMRFGLGQSTTAQTTLRAGADGHFRLTASANGVPVSALIDTGATNVIIGSAAANRLGLDYRRGKAEVAETAGGRIRTYAVTLGTLQVGEIVLRNVPCNVLEGVEVARGLDMLIGNSFLSQVQMQRNGSVMTLIRANGL